MSFYTAQLEEEDSGTLFSQSSNQSRLSTISSVAAVRRGEKNAAREEDEAEFRSIRARVLYRFIWQVATALHLRRDAVFNFVRYQVRYASGSFNQSDGDAAAADADTPEDRQMIEIVEACFLNAGYVILRALAALREVGTDEVQSMGLYALIRTKVLLTPFIKIISLLWIDSSLYTGRKYSSENQQRLDISVLIDTVQFFKTTAALKFDVDSDQAGDGVLFYPMNKTEQATSTHGRKTSSTSLYSCSYEKRMS